MSIPSIDSLPTAPNRNDPANFSDLADIFVAALPIFEQQTNAAIDAMNLDLADASANITAATATANYKGTYSTLTGALNTPASVYHNGIIYVLTANLTDVTLKVPGVDPEWTAFGISDAITASSAEINKLDGVTTTTAQFNYLNTTTSNVQVQLDGKAASVHTHLSSSITDASSTNITNRIVLRDGNGDFAARNITATSFLGNASTAAKLQTTRAISLGGDCSGSVNFDGSGPVTIPVTVLDNSHSHTSDNISDATDTNVGSTVVRRSVAGNFSAGVITATLAGNASSATTAASCTGNAATATLATNANAVDGQSFTYNYVTGNNSATYVWASNVNGDSFLARRDQLSVLYAASAGTATTTTGNAATASSATKLTTARSINVSGGATGTAQFFDGTSGITIPIVITNNSHSHESSNISDASATNNTAGTIVKRGTAGAVTLGAITGSLIGNASSASSAAKWTTARSITLSGHVSGTSPTWDGSGSLAFSGTTVSGIPASAVSSGTFATARIPTGISITGNAATATLASTLTTSTSASSSLYNMLWNSGNTIYNEAGVRVQPSSDSIYANGNITAYYSDERLKDRTASIENALDKILSLDAFLYKENELARSLGYNKETEQVGLSAQQVQAVMPQIVSLAPCDLGIDDNGVEYSISGENYLTVDYAKLVPLLVASIQELTRKVEALENR